MKLAELNPKFLDSHGERQRIGVAVSFDCPCGCASRVCVHINPPLDGGPPISNHCWERAGDTFDTLTLKPSILRVNPERYGCCGWHGFVTAGEVTSC